MHATSHSPEEGGSLPPRRHEAELYEDEEALYSAGYVLALTDNVELNQLLMQREGDVLDTEKVFGWVPSDSPTKEDQLTGKQFWRFIPPAVISSELLQAESSFETVKWEDGMTLPSGDWHPYIFCAANNSNRTAGQCAQRHRQSRRPGYLPGGLKASWACRAKWRFFEIAR